MADLLGSILGSMEKPPVINSQERQKAKAQQKQMEKIQQHEKEKLNHFRMKVQKDIEKLIKDSKQQKHKFSPMEKNYRAVIHDVAEVAGLVSFSFGEEGIDRFIAVWKKEFAPCDDEMTAMRNGEDWNEEIAQELAKNRALAAEELAKESSRPQSATKATSPTSNYRDKYQHLIGKDAGKMAANATTTNRSYGDVPSENKRDLRTIEEVLAENKAKKRLKTEHVHATSAGSPGEQSNTS